MTEASEPNDGQGNKAPGADQGPEQEGGPHSGQNDKPGDGKGDVEVDTRTSVSTPGGDKA